ncbi:MAG: TetR/AcrR family transcriptional regulator [Ktedonobacteraceae bacterium]
MVARSVKAHEYAEKRNAILNVAQRYISTKGYEQMTTQDILADLQISRGAFYHYFDSKAAVLFALVERRGDQLEQLVLPIVHDPSLSALDKLRRYFATHNHVKLENKGLVLTFMHVWYADENALLRHKLSIEGRKRLVPWLSQIIQEGVVEGVFTTPYPDQTARLLIALFEDFGNAIVELLLTENCAISDNPQITQMSEATVDALERILGAQPGCLQDTWREALSQW